MNIITPIKTKGKLNTPSYSCYSLGASVGGAPPRDCRINTGAQKIKLPPLQIYAVRLTTYTAHKLHDINPIKTGTLLSMEKENSKKLSKSKKITCKNVHYNSYSSTHNFLFIKPETIFICSSAF